MEPEKLYTEIFGFTDELLKSNTDVRLRVGGYSMYPVLKPGDIIQIHRVSSETLIAGDIIVYKSEKKWIAHRIQKIEEVSGQRTFYTRGDSCKTYDARINEGDIIGKVTGFSRKKRWEDTGKNHPEKKLMKSIKNGMFSSLISLQIRFILGYKKILNYISDIFHNIVFLTVNSKMLFRKNILISFFMGLFPLLIIYLVKRLTDLLSGMKTASYSFSQFIPILWIIGFIALAYLMQSLFVILSGLLREKLSQSVTVYINGLIHRKHVALGMEYLENAEKQDKIHKAVNEAGFRPQKMIAQLLVLIQGIVSWFLIAFLLFKIHWSVFFLALLAVIPSFLVRLKYVKNMYRFSRENAKKEREAFYYSRILTTVPFAKELRLFGTQNFFISRFEKMMQIIYDQKNLIIKNRFLPEISTQFFAVLLIFLSFSIVAYMTINGIVTIGTFILFILIFQRGYALMKEVFQSAAALVEDSIFLRDLHDFLALPVSTLEQTNYHKIKPLEKKIILKNVSFSYPNSGRMALKQISLEIPKGKTIALVGANGSGKTTLIKLLCGFYLPSDGLIIFDDQDVSEIKPNEIREQITAVFQDFALYNLSAEENISLGDFTRKLSSAEIMKAAENAGIADVLESLPFSYKTMLGNLFEKGEELSIGQWQKIALARAFYRNSPIVLLDEPSSALDTETEAQLLQGLIKLKEQKTVVIVSHRFSTIKWADMIYVMDEGKIIESGIHEELMSKKGRYFDLFKALN
jgi:ATP-binding cassette, subfamily B, bacterial